MLAQVLEVFAHMHRARSPQYIRMVALMAAWLLNAGLFQRLVLPKTSVGMAEVEAVPAETTAAISGSCNDSPVTAFAPNLAYTFTFPTPARTALASCTATVALTGAVNGDTAPTTIGCSLTDQAGFVVASSRAPTMKLGGLQCTVQDRAILAVHGDGGDNLNIDIALDTAGSSSWAAGKKVDATTITSKAMLFGAGGQVGTAAIIDGSDYDLSTNGEVTFGGATASEGASRTYVKVDYTNYDVQAATDVETLTFTFTPQ